MNKNKLEDARDILRNAVIRLNRMGITVAYNMPPAGKDKSINPELLNILLLDNRIPCEERGEGNLEKHARYELEEAGVFSEDSDYGGLLGTAVMELIHVFAEQGHSGLSAPMAISLFSRVASFGILSPLTGEPDEWNDISDLSEEPRYQNKRCGNVFKNDKEAYDIDGIIFEDPDGSRYTNRYSRVPVTFPYMPQRKIVPSSEDPGQRHIVPPDFTNAETINEG